MDARPTPPNGLPFRRTLEIAEDLGLLSPEDAFTTRTWLAQSLPSDRSPVAPRAKGEAAQPRRGDPTREADESAVLRSCGLDAAQVRALTRLGQAAVSSDPPHDDLSARIAEEILQERERWKGSVAAGEPNPAKVDESAEAAPVVPDRARFPRRLGDYILLAKLGEGGMGEVFRARHARIGKFCAVKVLRGNLADTPKAVERFRREASAVMRLGRHPNIVAVHQLGEEGRVHFFAMDLVTGPTLRQAMRGEAFGPLEAAALIEKVARALHFAHEHGIVHRDIKPENPSTRLSLRRGPRSGQAPGLVLRALNSP